jgi:hypothetical protein
MQTSYQVGRPSKKCIRVLYSSERPLELTDQFNKDSSPLGFLVVFIAVLQLHVDQIIKVLSPTTEHQ